MNVDSDKKISKIGLGTWQFGSSEWGYGSHYDRNESHAIVKRAIQLGVTLFDTAEIYNSGQSELILGQAIAESRDSVFLATKLWPMLPAARMVARRALASADRLGVSRIDLYQAHWPNPLVPDSAIMRGMRDLQRAGLVGEVGVSNYSVDRWRAAEDALRGKVLSNQVGYSLLARSAEKDLLPFAESCGRVIIAHSPLAMGLLSGRYHGTVRTLNRVRAATPIFQPESLDLTSGLIETLRAVAAVHSATPAQIALAWVIRSPAVAAIPGASSVRQLEENVAAADIELADDEYEALNAASAQFVAAGPGHVSGLRQLRGQLSAVRHSVSGARYLVQTARYDRIRSRHPHRAPRCLTATYRPSGSPGSRRSRALPRQPGSG
jgi:aryl-alcohol dehydrogenase-like predicted oxidoreductase